MYIMMKLLNILVEVLVEVRFSVSLFPLQLRVFEL